MNNSFKDQFRTTILLPIVTASFNNAPLCNHLNFVSMNSAIFFASLSETVFLSNGVIPGPGFRINFTISASVLTLFDSRTFLCNVFCGVTIFPPSGWHIAQCCLNSASPDGSAPALITIPPMINKHDMMTVAEKRIMILFIFKTAPFKPKYSANAIHLSSFIEPRKSE